MGNHTWSVSIYRIYTRFSLSEEKGETRRLDLVVQEILRQRLWKVQLNAQQSCTLRDTMVFVLKLYRR